jgi:hypothetical protein
MVQAVKHGYDHRRRPQDTARPGEQLLPRAHRAISNLKAWIYGTHRGVGDKHLQVYLDEYVFRHNRRLTPMAAFQTLCGLSSTHQPTTYARITGEMPPDFVWSEPDTHHLIKEDCCSKLETKLGSAILWRAGTTMQAAPTCLRGLKWRCPRVGDD